MSFFVEKDSAADNEGAHAARRHVTHDLPVLSDSSISQKNSHHYHPITEHSTGLCACDGLCRAAIKHI